MIGVCSVFTLLDLCRYSFISSLGRKRVRGLGEFLSSVKYDIRERQDHGIGLLVCPRKVLPKSDWNLEIFTLGTTEVSGCKTQVQSEGISPVRDGSSDMKYCDSSFLLSEIFLGMDIDDQIKTFLVSLPQKSPT